MVTMTPEEVYWVDEFAAK